MYFHLLNFSYSVESNNSVTANNTNSRDICENTLEVIVQNFGDVFCITGEAIIAELHRCCGIVDTLSFSHVSIEWLRISLF